MRYFIFSPVCTTQTNPGRTLLRFLSNKTPFRCGSTAQERQQHLEKQRRNYKMAGDRQLLGMEICRKIFLLKMIIFSYANFFLGQTSNCCWIFSFAKILIRRKISSSALVETLSIASALITKCFSIFSAVACL